MQLKEYLSNNEITKSAFARDIPCHYTYIIKIIKGEKKPSYEMARRIEQITNGQVKRTNWYPNE